MRAQLIPIKNTMNNKESALRRGLDLGRGLYAAGRRMIAQARYNEFARCEVTFASPEIRAEILAMSRADVSAQLAKLRTNYPALQSAHREGDDLSDHDLRAMLDEDAMKLTKDCSGSDPTRSGRIFMRQTRTSSTTANASCRRMHGSQVTLLLVAQCW